MNATPASRVFSRDLHKFCSLCCVAPRGYTTALRPAIIVSVTSRCAESGQTSSAAGCVCTAAGGTNAGGMLCIGCEFRASDGRSCLSDERS